MSQCPIQVHLQDPAIGGHQQQLIMALDITARHAILQKSHRKEAFLSYTVLLWIHFYLNRIFVYSILQTDTARNNGWVFYTQVRGTGVTTPTFFFTDLCSHLFLDSSTHRVFLNFVFLVIRPPSLSLLQKICRVAGPTVPPQLRFDQL